MWWKFCAENSNCCLLIPLWHFFQDAKSTSVASAGDDGPETEKLLHLFVQRCQHNLLALNRFLPTSSGMPKTGKGAKGAKPTDWAKKLYSQALLLPGSQSPNYLSELISLIENVSKNVSAWAWTSTGSYHLDSSSYSWPSYNWKFLVKKMFTSHDLVSESGSCYSLICAESGTFAIIFQKLIDKRW